MSAQAVIGRVACAVGSHRWTPLYAWHPNADYNGIDVCTRESCKKRRRVPVDSTEEKEQPKDA